MGKVKQQRSNNGKFMTQKENIFQLVEEDEKYLISLLEDEIKEFSNIVESNSENKIKGTFSQIKNIISALYIKEDAPLKNKTLYNFNEYDSNIIPIKLDSIQKEAVLFKRFLKNNILNLHKKNIPRHKELNKLITTKHVTALCEAFASYLDQMQLLNHDFLPKSELENLAKKNDLEALLLLGENDSEATNFLNHKTPLKQGRIKKHYLKRGSSLGDYRCSWILLDDLIRKDIEKSIKKEPTRGNLEIYKRHIQNLEKFIEINPTNYFISSQLAYHYLSDSISIHEGQPESQPHHLIRYAKKVKQYSPSKGLEYLLEAIEVLEHNEQYLKSFNLNLIAAHHYIANDNEEWKKHIENCYTLTTKCLTDGGSNRIDSLFRCSANLKLLQGTTNLKTPKEQRKFKTNFSSFVESLNKKNTLGSKFTYRELRGHFKKGFYFSSNNHINESITIKEILKKNISLPNDIDRLKDVISTSDAREFNPFVLLERATRAQLKNTISDDTIEINNTITKAEKEKWYPNEFNKSWIKRIKELNLSKIETSNYNINLTTEILNDLVNNQLPFKWAIYDDFEIYDFIKETDKNKATEFLKKRFEHIFKTDNDKFFSNIDLDFFNVILHRVEKRGEFELAVSSIIGVYLIKLLHLIIVDGRNPYNKDAYLELISNKKNFNQLLFKGMDNFFPFNYSISQIHHIKPNEFLKQCYHIWDEIHPSDEKLSEYEMRDNFLFDFLKEHHHLENIKKLKELRSEFYDLINSTNTQKYNLYKFNLFSRYDYIVDTSSPISKDSNSPKLFNVDYLTLKEDSIPKFKKAEDFFKLIQKAHPILLKFSNHGSTEDAFILSRIDSTIKKWIKLNTDELGTWSKYFTGDNDKKTKLISNTLDIPVILEQFNETVQKLRRFEEDLKKQKRTLKSKSLEEPLESPRALLQKLKHKKTTKNEQEEIYTRLDLLSVEVNEKLYKNVFSEATQKKLQDVNDQLKDKNYEIEKVNHELKKAKSSIKNMIQQSTHSFNNTIVPERLSNIAQIIREDKKFHNESLLLMDAYQAELTLKLQNDLFSKKTTFEHDPNELRHIIKRYTVSQNHENRQTICGLFDFCFRRVLSRILNDNTSVNLIIGDKNQSSNKTKQSLLLDFQNKIIFSKEGQPHSYTWCNSNFRPVKLKINNSIWDSVGIEKRQSSEALFYGHFSEIITNAFKYADHSQKHFLEITCDETHKYDEKFLSINFSNPYKKDSPIESTKQGLNSIRHDLLQLNNNKNKELDNIINSEDADFLPVSTENGKFSITYLINHEFLIAENETRVSKFFKT
jgi:hypothetical protein